MRYADAPSSVTSVTLVLSACIIEHQYEQQREGEQIKTADGQPQ